MSIQAVAWAIEQGEVPARPALVLISIANHANHIDGYCWLKAETIAREARCKPRSVFRFIAALVRNGYIRKAPKRGEDGKQRANDYWLLFDRDEKPWDWGANPDEDVADHDVDETAPETDETQDVVEPYDTDAHGETPPPDDSGVTRKPVEKHAVSLGPCDSRVSHKDSAEPSESNSKASSARARVHQSTLRAYRPPPSQPMGADTEHDQKPVFVYEGTDAYKKWAKVEAAKAGLRSWNLSTRAFIEGKNGEPGKWRSGWWFPTLFPPEQQPRAGPDSAHLTKEDIRDFKA